MLAASTPDLDGAGKLISQEAYWDYHHIVGHNLLVGIVLSTLLAAFSHKRLKALLIYLGLFHLHLVMDYHGSGPHWSISYFWPFSDWAIEYAHAWPFYSWQNLSFAFFFIAWMLAGIVIHKRTPLEYPMPSLDRQIVDLGARLVGRRQESR